MALGVTAAQLCCQLHIVYSRHPQSTQHPCTTWTLIRWKSSLCNVDLHLQAVCLIGVLQANAPEKLVARRSTFVEGLYSGLVTSPFTASPDPGQAPDSPFPNCHSQQPVPPDLMEAKLKLLVEAPAAVEDALASLLNHADPEVQVCYNIIQPVTW